MEPFALAPERLFRGFGESTESGMAVVTRGPLIEEILPRARLPRRMRPRECPGMTLLPGLIDTHIHLDEWVPPLCLAGGITTVRDTANHPDWILELRSRSASPDFPGPRVLCAGPALDGFPYIHPRISWGLRSPEDATLAVQALARLGVDAIKLYVGLDGPMVEQAAAAAASLGLPSLGHFDSKVPLLEAVRRGVREAEHLSGLPDPFDPAAVLEITTRGVWMVPTQVVWESLLHRVDEPGRMEVAMRHVPQRVLGWWERFQAATVKADPGLRRLRDSCALHRRYLSGLIAAGARIAAGTDAPCQFVVPGDALIDELVVLTECGMTAAQALGASTARAAELLGIAGETGTIEAGKRADLLLVRGDPLNDLRALASVDTVYRQGTPWDPAALLSGMKPELMSADSFPDPFEQATEWEDWKPRYLAQEETPWRSTGPT